MLEAYKFVVPVLVLAYWLAVAYRRQSGTTLRAPTIWAAIALASVVLVEGALGMSGASMRSSTNWRYLAGVASLLPAMALLGAKRPQDQGWQFVVTTLWMVLALPALQSLVLSPQSPLELHPAWRAFLALLVGVTLLNHLPTRFALTACLVTAAQLLLVHPHLRLSWPGSERAAVLTALSLAAAGATVAGMGWPRREMATKESDRVWRDFRDAFGAVWAFRVMDRVNHAVRQAGRAEGLEWKGFEAGWNPLSQSAETTDPFSITIHMLLRRFVSSEWIDRRRSGAS